MCSKYNQHRSSNDLSTTVSGKADWCIKWVVGWMSWRMIEAEWMNESLERGCTFYRLDIGRIPWEKKTLTICNYLIFICISSDCIGTIYLKKTILYINVQAEQKGFGIIRITGSLTEECLKRTTKCTECMQCGMEVEIF